MGYKEKRLKRKAGIAFTKMPETFASENFYFKFLPKRLKKIGSDGAIYSL